MSHNLLERGEPALHLLVHPVLRRAELRVKVLAVRARLHGEREDGSHKHAVVWAERGAVCVREASDELLILVGNRVAHGQSSEFEGAKEPHEALGGWSLRGASGALVLDELLEGARLLGSGLVQAGLHFLLPARNKDGMKAEGKGLGFGPGLLC